MGSMSDYYQNKIGLCLERGIVQEDTVYYNKKTKKPNNVMVYVPAVMPELEGTIVPDKMKSSQSNVTNIKESTKINKKVNTSTVPCYEVMIPEWIASNIRVKGIIKKGQVLYLGFLGGDINFPIVLGGEIDYDTGQKETRR